MIEFRCGRCAGAVHAADDRTGRAVPCPRCGHVNVCPDRDPAPAAARSVGTNATTSRSVWVLAGALVLAGLGWGTWTLLVDTGTISAPNLGPSPIEARQEEILKQDIDAPGDPALGRMFHDLNVHHFSGRLPQMPVMWEPRLAEVGALAARTFTLEGMFGHIGDRAIILLNTSLQSDRPAVLRALSHEMVHAFLYTLGEDSSDHGPLFQAELKRLSAEGAFTGIVATDAERARLRAWLDRESARLDADSAALTRKGEQIEHERADLDRELSELHARLRGPDGHSASTRRAVEAFNASRDAYNRDAEAANARIAQGRADRAEFNRQVRRYNLMLVYPDGLVEGEQISRR